MCSWSCRGTPLGSCLWGGCPFQIQSQPERVSAGSPVGSHSLWPPSSGHFNNAKLFIVINEKYKLMKYLQNVLLRRNYRRKFIYGLSKDIFDTRTKAWYVRGKMMLLHSTLLKFKIIVLLIALLTEWRDKGYTQRKCLWVKFLIQDLFAECIKKSHNSTVRK